MYKIKNKNIKKVLTKYKRTKRQLLTVDLSEIWEYIKTNYPKSKKS